MTGSQFEEIFRKHAGMAYGLALGVAGEPSAAEDAVQEAFMYLWRTGAESRAVDVRAYLASAVISAARDSRRGEARRRAREEAVLADSSGAEVPAGAAESAEQRGAVRAALLGLPEDRRLPVLLHVVQDFSQREVARILDLPVSTVSHRINAGLDELRSSLSRAGFAGLAGGALAATLQASWNLPVPAGLAAKIGAMAALPATAGGATSVAALKGGVLVKIGLGVAAVGLVAGATFWAVGGKTEEPAKPPPVAEKKSKFDIPIWHPDARWEVSPERFAGLTREFWNTGGSLDGPRREVMWRGSRRPSLCGGMMASGRYYFMSYDEKTERFHGVTGGQATGNLDGPFSRARFGCTEYFPRQGLYEVQSPDKRYVYVVTVFDRKTTLRCLDFATQAARTLPTGKGSPINVSVDGQGKVYVVTYPDYELLIMDPAQDWKSVRTVALKAEEKLHLLSCSLAVDEVHGRLYATAYGPKSWYVWYWDTKDGSFHGVVPIPQAGDPRRPGSMGGATPGPFKGVCFYNEGSVSFGPDDPEKRFLYMGRVDDRSLYRLDLVKEVIWAFDSRVGAFVDQGDARRPMVLNLILPVWLEDGSFLGSPVAADYYLYRRVK